MKFEKLSAGNFLTLQSCAVSLDGRGLNVIQGNNEDNTSADSNGAGKSSLVDALCWCLFAVTARGVKGDAVVNRAAKKDTWVSLTLVHGGTRYRVTRYRKHKEHKNALLVTAESTTMGAAPADLTKGTDAETQKVLEKILGCSQDVFMAAVYSGQEAMPDLPRMTDRELKRLIEEGAGLQRIELAYEEARARRTALTNQLQAADNAAANIAARIARDESALAIKAVECDAWSAKREERLQTARDAVEAAIKAAREAGAALIASKPAHDALVAERAELVAELSKHSAVEAAARAAERAAADADNAIDRAGLAIAQRAVAAIQTQIDNAAEELAKPCPECGKPHTKDELDEYVAHRTKRLVEAQANLEAVKKGTHERALLAVAAKKAAEEARAKVPDVSGNVRRRTEIDALMKARDNAMEDLRRLKQNVDAAQNALAMRESEVNPLDSVVAQLREQIRQETEEFNAKKAQCAELYKKLEVAEAVVKVFGPAGVRAHILDTVTPFLNERTADYLSALSDGAIQATWTTLSKSASGDLKEKFSIEVTTEKDGDSFAALSGGEKRKVRLATALALQDLVASRASHPIDLWIGDEVDDALDPAGLERLMTILERKARERGTVLVISHNDLADWCDQITTVRKKDGFSTVEGSLCD
jgi:DNA repair exonuclease SbcCD ATPase subunit